MKHVSLTELDHAEQSRVLRREVRAILNAAQRIYGADIGQLLVPTAVAEPSPLEELHTQAYEDFRPEHGIKSEEFFAIPPEQVQGGTLVWLQ